MITNVLKLTKYSFHINVIRLKYVGLSTLPFSAYLENIEGIQDVRAGKELRVEHAQNNHSIFQQCPIKIPCQFIFNAYIGMTVVSNKPWI